MPTWTSDDGSPASPEDVPIVQLIQALSGLQEPARTVLARCRAVLEENATRLPKDVRMNIEELAGTCDLLGTSTTAAIRKLVAVLQNGRTSGET